MSVILNAPSVFQWTATANPKLHLNCAELMGADIRGATLEDAGNILSDTIISLIRKVGLPNGLNAVGFKDDDIDDLVEGTLPQHRVTKLSPIPVGASELKELFLGNMKHWYE